MTRAGDHSPTLLFAILRPRHGLLLQRQYRYTLSSGAALRRFLRFLCVFSFQGDRFRFSQVPGQCPVLTSPRATVMASDFSVSTPFFMWSFRALSALFYVCIFAHFRHFDTPQSSAYSLDSCAVIRPTVLSSDLEAVAPLWCHGHGSHRGETVLPATDKTV